MYVQNHLGPPLKHFNKYKNTSFTIFLNRVIDIVYCDWCIIKIMSIVNLSESDANLITTGNVGAKGQFNIYIYIYLLHDKFHWKNIKRKYFLFY